MSTRFKVLLYSLLATFLVVVLLLTLPLLYDPEQVRVFFLQQLEENLGRKIDIGEARLEFFPRPRVDLHDVTVWDLDPTKVFLRARRVDIVLRLLPLLNMEVVGKRLTIENPQIELRRDHTGQWNFSAVVDPSFIGAATRGTPARRLLLVRESRVIGGSVTVIDEFRPDGVRTVQFRALNLTVVTSSKGLPIDLGVSATVAGAYGATAFSLVGRITESEAPATLGRSRPRALGAVLQFEGSTELVNVDIRQVMDFFGPRPVPVDVQGSADVRGNLRLLPGVAGYDLVLSDLQISIEPLDMKGRASLSGLLTAQPTFSVTFSADPVRLRDLLTLYPAEWLPYQIQEVLAERQAGGMVEVIEATVTGSTEPEPRVSLTGEFSIQEGHVLIGAERTAAKNVSGTVLIEPDRARVVNLTGQHGAMRVTDGTVLVSFRQSGPWLEVQLTGDMAANDLVAVLAKKIRSPDVAKQLRSLRDVQGRALVTFELEGAGNEPDGLQFVGGDFVAQEIDFQSSELRDPVIGLKGRLRYTKAAVEFDQVSGRLGQTQFQVHGTITTGKASEYKGFSVWARADASQLVGLLPVQTPLESKLQGIIGLAFELSGQVKMPNIKGVMELNETAIAYPGVIEKPIGLPASVEFDAALPRKNQLKFKRVDLLMAPLHVTGKGNVGFGKGFSLDVALVSKPISLDKLPKGITVAGAKSGTLEVSLDLKGQGKDWRAWDIQGWVALTDGVLATKNFDYPLTDVYLRLRLVRNGADLKRLQFRIKDSDLRLSGTIKNWKKKPRATLRIESDQLDIDLLIPKDERSPIRDMLENLAASSHVVASSHVSRGIYKNLALKDLSGRITISDGVLDVDQITAQSDGGQLAGHLIFQIPKGKPAEAEASFGLADLPFEKVLVVAGDNRRLINGTFSATGTIRGHGRNPRGVLNTLKGSIEFIIKDGRIRRGTVVPKIIAILNVPMLLQGKVNLAKDGFPFDKITGALKIRNGLVSEKNLVVDSPIMKMSAAGTYDMTTDQLDTVWAASPLGSYSALLKSIPLFGHLFAGERRGIDTALFEVRGPIQNPQVNYMPMESFATGLTGMAQFAVDVLINTVTLPATLMAPEDGQTPPAEGDQKDNVQNGASAPNPPAAP